MESTALNESLVLELAALLDEHNAQNTVVLDLRAMQSFTDFFVIAHATSATHMRSLVSKVKDGLDARGVRGYRPSYTDDGSWNLVDAGTAVFHLMSAEARAFYELEKLWFKAPVIYGAPPR